jgi:hypothetical protein
MTEGPTDQDFLTAMDPVLSRAAFRDRGGRKEVLRIVNELKDFDLPILGIVDRDLEAEPVPALLSDLVFEWPCADIEASILSDPAALDAMAASNLLRPGITTDDVMKFLTEAQNRRFENAAAELSGRRLRSLIPNELPSPKGDDPLQRLRDHLLTFEAIDASKVDEIIEQAKTEVSSATEPWRYHRGKQIANELAGTLSESKSGFALLRATVTAMEGPFAAAAELIESARAKLLG